MMGGGSDVQAAPLSPSPLDSLTPEQTAKLNAVLCTGKAALSFGEKDINKTELNILLKLFGMEDWTDTIMTKLDADNSDSLSFDELMGVIGNNQAGVMPLFTNEVIDVVHIREAFDACDAGGTGVIDRNDLIKVFRRLGKHPTEEALDKLLDVLDLDHNGEVNWMEFLYAMVDGTVDKLGISMTNLQQLVENQIHFLYTVHDPSNAYPEQVAMTISPSHVEVINAESQQILAIWRWSHVSRFIAERQSDDPTDMELFTVEINGDAGTSTGQYVFECDDAHELKQTFHSSMMMGMQLEASGKDFAMRTTNSKGGKLSLLQRAAVRAAYSCCDLDTDEPVSMGEAELVLMCLGFRRPHLSMVLARMDQTGTGEVFFEEFTAILKYEHRHLEKTQEKNFLDDIVVDFAGLRLAFNCIDITGTRQMDFTILRGLFQRLGAAVDVTFTPNLLAQIWFEIDAQGYGFVDWLDFLHMLLQGDLWPHDPRLIKLFKLQSLQVLEDHIKELEEHDNPSDDAEEERLSPKTGFKKKSVMWRDEHAVEMPDRRTSLIPAHSKSAHLLNASASGAMQQLAMARQQAKQNQQAANADANMAVGGAGQKRDSKGTYVPPISDISIFSQSDSVMDMFEMQRAEEEKQLLQDQLPADVKLAVHQVVHATMKKARSSADALVGWCIRVPELGIGVVLETQKERMGKPTSFVVRFDDSERRIFLDRKDPMVGKRMYEGGALKWYKYPFELLYHTDSRGK